MKNKNIILQINKKCKICGRDYIKDGIMIMKNCICDKCNEEITNINVDNKNYDNIKNKIKYILNDIGYI